MRNIIGYIGAWVGFGLFCALSFALFGYVFKAHIIEPVPALLAFVIMVLGLSASLLIKSDDRRY